MEDLLTEVEANIDEMHSGLVTLQVAVQAEHEQISYKNIDDCLTMIINKLEQTALLYSDIVNIVNKDLDS